MVPLHTVSQQPGFDPEAFARNMARGCAARLKSDAEGPGVVAGLTQSVLGERWFRTVSELWVLVKGEINFHLVVQ